MYRKIVAVASSNCASKLSIQMNKSLSRDCIYVCGHDTAIRMNLDACIKPDSVLAIPDKTFFLSHVFR